MSDKTITSDERAIEVETPTAAARGQKMAAALSSYARALTFENRSRRNLYRLADLSPRIRDRVFSVILMMLIGFTFVLPMAASTVYFGFLASPGYVSEVRFIVRSSVPFLSRDRYSSETVEPKAKIVQDTAVLLNYLSSPAVIQDLQTELNLKQIYGRNDIDLLSRLRPDATQEDILKYWKKHFTATVNPKSGIVELNVVAYSAPEAQQIVKALLKLSEAQVNKMSAGMWGDLLQASQRDVDAATKELSDLRDKVRDTQNKTGVFDIQMSADSLATVLTGIETQIADLTSRRIALSQSVSPSSPQMSDLNRRLEALQSQANELQEKIAGSSKNLGSSGSNLANYASTFQSLGLDLGLAEGKLRSAISELEKVKLVSSLQLVYIDNFTDPTKPDRSTYPKIVLSLFLYSLAFLAICGTSCGIVLYVRKKWD